MVGIIGNGKILAKIDDSGSLEYIFFPHLGHEKHIFDSSFAIFYDNKLKWNWDNSWDINQNYLKDTNILKTSYENEDFLIESKDYVPISHNSIIKQISILNKSSEKKNLKLFFYENLRMGEIPEVSTVKYRKNRECIIKYDKNYVFCIGSNKKVSSYQCGVRSSESSALNDLKNGILKEYDSAEGLITDSALGWDLELSPNQEQKVSIFIFADKYGGDYTKIMNLLDTLNIVITNHADIYDLTMAYWKNMIETTANSLCNSNQAFKDLTHIKDDANISNLKRIKQYEAICKRSLLTILLLCDHNGGIIASPSLYPDYRYVWCRDAGYMAVALDLCGQHGISEKYFEWCKKTQNSDGSWVQNYYVEGNPRLTAIQIDQVGTTIWAALVHYRITRDKLFLNRYWEMIKKAGDYLSSVANPPSPSYDLWEEKYGVFAYTLGAIYGGLKSAYNICKILGKEEHDIQNWKESMDFLKNEMVDRLYLKDENRFAKSLDPLDKALDASILGLSFSYNLVPVDDPRMISTANQIENAFKYKVGGIGRYPEDVYFGGNPWIITTIWLHMYYENLIKSLSKHGKNAIHSDQIPDSSGDLKDFVSIIGSIENHGEKSDETPSSDTLLTYAQKCNNLFDWTLKYNFNELFPEQVHKDLGAPISAIPLGWSHAMVIIAIHGNFDILIP